jgi:hypothetical protein
LVLTQFPCLPPCQPGIPHAGPEHPCLCHMSYLNASCHTLPPPPCLYCLLKVHAWSWSPTQYMVPGWLVMYPAGWSCIPCMCLACAVLLRPHSLWRTDFESDHGPDHHGDTLCHPPRLPIHCNRIQCPDRWGEGGSCQVPCAETAQTFALSSLIGRGASAEYATSQIGIGIHLTKCHTGLS